LAIRRCKPFVRIIKTSPVPVQVFLHIFVIIDGFVTTIIMFMVTVMVIVTTIVTTIVGAPVCAIIVTTNMMMVVTNPSMMTKMWRNTWTGTGEVFMMRTKGLQRRIAKGIASQVSSVYSHHI
jgi:hypothetical protein